MTGRLLGIARHDRPRGPMATIDHVTIGLETGVQGDFRGSLKPGRNKRQVTVMTADGWRAALTELGASIAWELRRVNLLVDGVALEETRGALLVFSGGVVLEITGECDPCSRMEEIAPGLKGALLPHWRGGVTCIVRQEGRIAVGDEVRIER
ncbi:MOSC domain-containing protein [Sphingomonas sp. BIUV-7]|uniref:MOSC domain-containing protein n=2 Tax=Sphingomonas natans TaxID=3063330 RepID=A0ABT8YCE4_9SPHN|nr:MOSC domain-containing protein [Sphingomonas sp. BIUV-7]